MKWGVPTVLWPTCGRAEGETRLNAFDNALVAAGVGQWNLVKVTSVAPPNALVVDSTPLATPGCLVPSVLTSVTSERPGERISACIGIGLGADSHGMIMEHSAPGSPEEIERIVRGMVREAFAHRGLQLDQVIVRSVSHTVERVGSCVAAVVLWWE